MTPITKHNRYFYSCFSYCSPASFDSFLGPVSMVSKEGDAVMHLHLQYENQKKKEVKTSHKSDDVLMIAGVMKLNYRTKRFMFSLVMDEIVGKNLVDFLSINEET